MLKKLLSVLLCAILLTAVVPTTGAMAAAPSVETIGGERTAFLSSFGKLSYMGEARAAFKTLDEAIAALGKEGGRIVFTGKIDMSSYVDAPGRGSITFEGIGAKVTGNTLDFGEAACVNWQGNTYINNVLISTAADVPIYTNGFEFSTIGGMECKYTETFVESGSNTIVYDSPFIFATGANSSGAELSAVSLSSGHYKAVVGGAYADKAVNASTTYNIGGGIYESVFAGNHNSTASFSGASTINVSGGTVTKLVAGSDSGTTNANLNVNIYGGEVRDLVIGSTNGAAVNGNVCINLSDGEVSAIVAEKSTISGKVIIIDSTKSTKIPEGGYDYLITSDDTTIAPVYNGTTLLGFTVGDKNGFIPTKVFVNGAQVNHTNGVFTFPEGKVSVTCESATQVEPNKFASYVSGYTDGTFLPQNNITRAEAITMLARIICADISKLSAFVTCGYSDVAADAWYAPMVGYFEKLGYLEKLETASGAKIEPDKYITRAEFSEISRHIISEIYDGREFGVAQFSDVPGTHTYYESIGQLGYLGVITGYEDGTFRPDNNITRAEAVTIINRFLGRTPTGNAGSVTFTDIGGHWANSQIITACNAATEGGVAVWTLKEDITVGNYTLLSGENVTVGDQIKHLSSQNGKISQIDFITGIDAISKWQINNIVNSPSEYSTSGKIFYISPKGDNENDGLSPETAWKNLDNAMGIKGRKLITAGDVILFERGGEWRGQMNCLPGVTYSAYGTGPKPIFNYSKRNYANAALWEETEYPNIYKLTDKISNVGIMAFDFTGILGNYNETVGDLKLAGVGGIETYADLKNDLEFFSNLSTSELYLYCEGGNPGKRFKSIEIGGGGNLVNIPAPGNVILDNLTFRFVGAHAVGIGGHKNVTVRNCTFDYLGGSVLRGFHGADHTRYGNALQVYGSCDGWYLYNNWVYQIYDTGVTHQYNSPYDFGSATMDNVKYVGNVIEYCHWSIEYYNPDYGNTVHTFHNTYIADNICRLNGYGWGSKHRMKSSTLFQSAGITQNTKNFVTENNIFDRSAGKLININSSGDHKLELRNNIYIQNVGGTMGTLFGANWIANDDAAKVVKNMAKDSTSIIIFNNDKTVNDYLIKQ